MYTARCDERKGRRSGRGTCPRRFRSVRRLASGVAAFRAIAWNELHGAKWMANGGPASLAAVRWPRQRFAVWSTPLSRKRCPFRGMSGKRACFLWGSVFARTTVHPGKKHQGAGAFSAPLQHHRRCRTGLAMAPASRDKASVPRRRRACGAALASSRAMTRASRIIWRRYLARDFAGSGVSPVRERCAWPTQRGARPGLRQGNFVAPSPGRPSRFRWCFRAIIPWRRKANLDADIRHTSSHSWRTLGLALKSATLPSKTMRPWPMT